ncbi:MAG: hypothetical protein RQ760_19740, partial [Sedimentisphaerales bacterium]|nr:hypothetical protein [Sedimentisphaerales bacterium]
MKYVSLIGALVIFTAGCTITPAASAEGKESQTKKVLIVTGIDYPGHKWKETSPVLAKAIAA